MMVASNKRVLVVDDEPIVCESYQSVLTKAGFSVTTARSGRDALAACRDGRFDVMLADLKMPGMDGLEVTRKVKQEFPQVQVLIITGYPTEHSAEQARRLGVFDYLSKPLSPEMLSAVTAAATATPAEPVTPVVPVTPVEPVTPAEPAIGPAPEEALPTTGATEPVDEDVLLAVEAFPESPLKTYGMLALAPLIGLAYVMLLPIIGFGMLFWMLGTRFARMLGLARG